MDTGRLSPWFFDVLRVVPLGFLLGQSLLVKVMDYSEGGDLKHQAVGLGRAGPFSSGGLRVL